MKPHEIINKISTNKFNTPSFSGAGYTYTKILATERFAPHMADADRLRRHVLNGEPAATFVPTYEPFEFRLTDGRTIGNILRGSIDLSDNNMLTCMSDTDVNAYMSSGAVNKEKTKIRTGEDPVTGIDTFDSVYVRRKYVIDYIKIDVIEYCIYSAV